jgi:hypothetical protein
VVAHHRVDAPLELLVAAPDGVAHPLETALLAQGLELLVEVEHEDGQGHPTGLTRGLGVQPDDEERRPRHAEGEVRVVRVGGHLRRPRLLVDVVQALEQAPQHLLEVLLVAHLGAAEAGDEGDEARLGVHGRGVLAELLEQCPGRLGCLQVVVQHHRGALPLEHRTSTEARVLRAQDPLGQELPELIGGCDDGTAHCTNLLLADPRGPVTCPFSLGQVLATPLSGATPTR